MAWTRDEARLNSSSFTAYSYTECDWEVGGEYCSYRHIGGITSPYGFGANATATAQWWESGTWHDYGSGSGTFNGYGDLALFDITDSFQRQAQDRVVSVGTYTTMMGASARSYIDYTVPHLAPSVTWAASNPVVRNSDNSITLTWDAPSLEYSAMCLEVSTDGGAWSQFAVLWNTATSYTWTGCSAGHSYQFRIRTNYLASYSDYDVCATIIVNTPLPPDKLTTQATSGTNVTVTLVNTSPVATSCEYRLGDGTNWGAVVTGQDTQSFSVDMGSDHYIQVRNANATGTSKWRQSSYINTVTKPNKPTLASNMNGGMWDSSKALALNVGYSSADGAQQEKYRLYVSINGDDPTTPTDTPKTAQSGTTWTLDVGDIGDYGLDVGDVVEFQISVKGASATWSDLSNKLTLTVKSKPTLNITSPDTDTPMTSMPLTITAGYTDQSGTPAEGGSSFYITKDGAKVYPIEAQNAPLNIEEDNGTYTLSATVSTSDFLPANNAQYTVVITARSSSGLSTSANATFKVDFVEPQAGELSIVNDPETGYASLLATFDNSASEITYTGSTNEQYESTEGYVRSLTVEGKSAKWNQIKQNSTFGSTTTYTGSRCSISASGNVLTATASSNDTPALLFPVDLKASRKYYLGVNIKPSELMSAATFASTNIRFTDLASGAWTRMDGIYSPAADLSASLYLYFNYNGANSGKSTQFRNLCIYDLTAIFGSGNEPSTVDAFKATDVYKAKLAAGELYDYDAGSLVSIEGAVVRGRNLADFTAASQYTINADGTLTLNSTGGFNIKFAALPSARYYVYARIISGGYTGTTLFTWQGASYYYDDEGTSKQGSTASELNQIWVSGSAGFTVGTVMELMVTSTQSTAYEPYSLTTITTPLRSAGSVHDELQADADSWTVERRVGVVDLGSLTWAMQSAAVNTFYTQALSGAVQTNNIVSGRYSNLGGQSITQGNIFVSSTRRINVCDGNYSDAASFKTAMSGVYAFYELATPTQDPETSIDTIEIGSAFTVATDLDSTFELTTWDGSADAVSISVARVNADGTITPLLTDGASGSGVVDKYAPLNTPYQYAVTTAAATQAVKTVYVDNELVTDLWFAYWTHREGDTVTEMTASAKWNPDNGGIQLSRPQKTRVYYAGRKDPVSYDGSAVALSETPSWMLVDRSEVQPFVQLIEDGGRGVYKSCDGWVYHADFDLTLSPKYTAIGYYGGIMLSVTRIAGDQL